MDATDEPVLGETLSIDAPGIETNVSNSALLDNLQQYESQVISYFSSFWNWAALMDYKWRILLTILLFVLIIRTIAFPSYPILSRSEHRRRISDKIGMKLK